MPKIRILPIEKEIDADLDESILDAALRQDVPIQHACGGFCACTTCHILVEDGTQAALSEMEEDEADRLERVSGGMLPNSRLACQAKVKSNVTVRVMNLETH